MNHNDLKRSACKAAAIYVKFNICENSIIGIGTGSTINYFIDELANIKNKYCGVISSSLKTTIRLQAYGINIFKLKDIKSLPIYIDGADEIDKNGAMIKGGGGALTKEKAIASISKKFICIADMSKRVDTLGKYPLPIEIIPTARKLINDRVIKIGGIPILRTKKNNQSFITKNGNEIIDVQGLKIINPKILEKKINSWPGVVTVGIFAKKKADICFLGTNNGVKTIYYKK